MPVFLSLARMRRASGRMMSEAMRIKIALKMATALPKPRSSAKPIRGAAMPLSPVVQV